MMNGREGDADRNRIDQNHPSVRRCRYLDSVLAATNCEDYPAFAIIWSVNSSLKTEVSHETAISPLRGRVFFFIRLR